MIYRTETRIDEDWFRELMADEQRRRTITAAIRAVVEQQLAARDAGFERIKQQRDELLNALEMVRDADEDAKQDGLPTMPPCARATIDAAIAKAGGER